MVFYTSIGIFFQSFLLKFSWNVKKHFLIFISKNVIKPLYEIYFSIKKKESPHTQV